jgi:SAM-dependent methyltransferase
MVIAPLLAEITRCRSVIDVGCGDGSWLVALRNNGVTDLLGVDGDHVRSSGLKIPTDQFHAADLSRPLVIPRRFDLAMSLEVAEHLPESAAEGFVSALTRLSDFVVFSAAVPNQGGVNHVNEQWPTYWAALFAEAGFTPVDCFRRRIWNDARVAFWYRQNILLFVRGDRVSETQQLANAHRATDPALLSLVHPEALAYKQTLLDDARELRGMRLRELAQLQFKLLRAIPLAVRSASSFRFKRLTRASDQATGPATPVLISQCG